MHPEEECGLGTDRKSLFDKALLGLRQMVLDGEFEANSRLPETSLAERLNVSRTPLREAMARLVEEGLLERNETGGCRVASFTTADILDAIELRGVMEGTAARLAAERGVSPGRLAECRELLERIDIALDASSGGIDFDGYIELNARFHEMVSELAESAIIAREVSRTSRLPLASPSAFLQGQAFQPEFLSSLIQAQQQHKAIIDAIGHREGARAEALAREHARLARKNLERAMSTDTGGAKRVPGLALVSP